MQETVEEFFRQVWSFVTEKHNQGVFNTVCLVVLLTLPLLVILTTCILCCHCCCCRHADGCCCCCCRRDSMTTARSKETKKKKDSADADDLWISVKPGAMMPDRVALGMV